MKPPTTLPSWLLAFAATACGRDGEATPAPARDYAAVAPILREHCVACHQPGGLSDLELVTYDDAAALAELIVAVTASRTMPPYAAVADGSCRDFRDVAWLTDDELERLAAWADDGAPPSASVHDVGPLPVVPHLGDDALAVAMAEPYTPTPAADDPDEYRCFLLDAALDTDAVVRATEFIPGDTELVHHVGVFAIDPEVDLGPFTNREAIAKMEADDPEPGWSCFGGIGAVRPRSQISGWVGGPPVVAMPEGSGMTLFAGELLVMQVHYRVHPGAEGRSDRTAIRLALEDDAERRITAVFQDPLTFANEGGGGGPLPSLAPGQADAQFEWELPAAVLWDEFEAQEGVSIDALALVGVGPHMHDLGTALEFEVRPPGEAATCGLEVQRWDYAWQNAYFYDAPLTIRDRDTQLHLRCHYDTRSRTTAVYPGHSSGHEMCGLMFYVTAD